jgi:transcriptional regulator with XRE-family HTH domain
VPRVILGKNVNRLRTARGLTQDQLAEGAEIDRRYVQRIEAGTANPGIDVLIRLRRALDCSWEELLAGVG